MRELAITKQDKDFMELAAQIRAKIKTPKDWQKFKQYTDFYFKKLRTAPDKTSQFHIDRKKMMIKQLEKGVPDARS